MTNTTEYPDALLAPPSEHFLARLVAAVAEERRLLRLPDSGCTPVSDAVRRGVQKGRAEAFAEALTIVSTGDVVPADEILEAARGYVDALFDEEGLLKDDERVMYALCFLFDVRKLARMMERPEGLDRYQVRSDLHYYAGFVVAGAPTSRLITSSRSGRS